MTIPNPPTQSGLATEPEPVQVTEPAAPPVPEVPADAAEPAAPPAESDVSTPGGLPVVPTVTVGTTGTIAAVSATGLAAGGPAALLAAGALVLAPVAVAMVRATPAGTLRRGPARTPGAQRSGGLPPQRPAPRFLGPAGVRRSAASGTGTGSGSGGTRRAAGTGSTLRQKAAAVRQVRRDSAAEAARKGRTATAADTTRARRQLADARRAERQQRRSPASAPGSRQDASGGRGRLSKNTAPTAPTSGGTRSQTGRGGAQSASAGRGGAAGRLWRAGRGAAAQTLARARRGTGTAPADKTPAATSQREPRGFLAARRDAYRAARDRIRDQWRAQQRARIEDRARTRARRDALRRSAARYHGRRALAVLAATPLGALSLVLWPLAKLLHIRPPRWGRAVWRKLCRAAQDERVARDVAAYQEHDQAEADQARWQRPAPPGVDRARPNDAPVPTTTQEDTVDGNGTGFDFREAASQMLEQAQKAEPGGMMQVLAQVETLPEALAAIAETFASVAAVMSPDNMPLHPDVNDALGELHRQLVVCVDAAEAVSETFQSRHEADIARHTDGRTAEEMWDVSRQED